MLTLFFSLFRTLPSGHECYLQKESNLSARNTMVLCFFFFFLADYYRKKKYILILYETKLIKIYDVALN